MSKNLITNKVFILYDARANTMDTKDCSIIEVMSKDGWYYRSPFIEENVVKTYKKRYTGLDYVLFSTDNIRGNLVNEKRICII